MNANTNQPDLFEGSFSVSPIHIDDDLLRYDQYLCDVRGLTQATRRNLVGVANHLLRRRFAADAVDLSELQPSDVRQFLASELETHQTASNASRLASGLRSYFRYRRTCGDQVDALIAVIPAPAHWKLASLPRALHVQEIEQLLESFQSVQRWPRRGYAIVRCALDLGLRAKEIANLKISDIDWRGGTVTLRGTKSRREDILPLPMETGQALADYLQHERRPVAIPHVFVRCGCGSPDKPLSSSAIQKVIKRAFRRCGLLHSGSHTLRHTLACRLVENGSSLKEVADLLRHRSLDTTLIYAKLDTPHLATVPLPWPGSES